MWMTNSWWEWVRDRERDWNKSVYNRATRVQYRNQKIDSGIIYYACVLSSMQRVGFSVCHHSPASEQSRHHKGMEFLQ